MNLLPNKPTKRKVTRTLDAEAIDKKRATSAFHREEQLETHKHNISVTGMYAAAIALPLCFVGWAVTTWVYHPEQLGNVFSYGITGVGGFLVSKVKLFGGTKKD